MKKWFHYALLALTLLVLLATTLYVAIRWRAIPEQVPVHYDGAGRVTGWAGKSSLLSLLAIDWFAAVIVAASARIPHSGCNSGLAAFRVSAVRFGRRSLPATGLTLDLLALLLALIFSYIAVCVALCRDLGSWFLPATLVAVFLPLLLPLLFNLKK